MSSPHNLFYKRNDTVQSFAHGNIMSTVPTMTQNPYSRLQRVLAAPKSPKKSPSSRLGSVCSHIKSSLASELGTPAAVAKDNGSSRSLSTCATVQSTVCNEEELAVTMEEEQAIDEQTCSPQTSSMRRNVSFQHIEIRRYDVTLGKHLNEYDLGPAITLDWSYHDEHEENNKVTVDEYEKARLPSRRSTEDLFALSRLEREEILQKQGIGKDLLDKVTQSTPIRQEWKNSLEF